jgi:hypothetical protein
VGETGRIKGLRVTKVIPFEGEAVLFNLQPSSSDLYPPRGVVQGTNLTLGMDVGMSRWMLKIAVRPLPRLMDYAAFDVSSSVKYLA